MEIFYTITLDKNSPIPLYQQLGDKIVALIDQGALAPNKKLPPIRKLAQHLGVNNSTVISAYKYLENKKILYSIIGSGTYISEIKQNDLPEPILKNQYNITEPVRFELKDAINFANSSTDPSLFPVDEFKILFNKVLDRDKGNAFSYQDAQGYPPLREEICKYLLTYHIKTGIDKIQIISGAQQGIDIISKVMLSMGDVVFVERPTFYGAVGAFLSRGAQVIEIDLEADGLDLNKLESLLKIYKPKFIYLMPYYQTPTCIRYSLEKKNKILALAAKFNTFIVEEDNQSEFTYHQDKVVPMKALDYKNRVLYVKSFSKILMPGLRLGFMVLPLKIIKNITSAKYTTDISTSGFIQRAFELYLNSPYWENHIRYMRDIFKLRYETAIAMTDTFLKEDVIYEKPAGGLNLWLKIADPNRSVKELLNQLLIQNVIVTPGAVFSMNGEDIPYIRISYANVSKAYIEQGIQLISEVFKQK